MTDLNNILTDRAAAGAAYATALADLRSAYVTLYGIDLALRNAKVGTVTPVRTFIGSFGEIPEQLRHPEFAPGYSGGVVDEARAAAAQVLAAFNGIAE